MEELDLIELFELFWRKKILIITIVIICGIIGTIYTYNFVTPKYEAYTKILLAQVSDIGADENVQTSTGITSKETINGQWSLPLVPPLWGSVPSPAGSPFPLYPLRNR